MSIINLKKQGELLIVSTQQGDRLIKVNECIVMATEDIIEGYIFPTKTRPEFVVCHHTGFMVVHVSAVTKMLKEMDEAGYTVQYVQVNSIPRAHVFKSISLPEKDLGDCIQG